MLPEKHGTDEAGLERRREQRHAVERTCCVSSGVSPQGAVSGLTVNISRTGMLVSFPGSDIAALLPKLSAKTRIAIDLPPSTRYPRRCLECTGRVVREVDSPDGRPGLAFEIHRMQVRDRETKRPRRRREDYTLVQ